MCQMLLSNSLHETFYLYLITLSFVQCCSSTPEVKFDFQHESDEEKRHCKHKDSPSFEVKAIMIPCSVKYCPCSNIPGQTCKSRDATGNTPEDNYRISNCTKKLVITVKMTNMGVMECGNQYVVVDHVYDPNSERKQRLLYPYVLKIKGKPIMQTYKLTRESSVNEKSTELVMNKNDEGYKGCKTTGEDTTCKKVVYKERPVPFSTGFCCSCDSHHLRKQINEHEINDIDKINENNIKEGEENFTLITERIERRGIKQGRGDNKNSVSHDETHVSSTPSKHFDRKRDLKSRAIPSNYQERKLGQDSFDTSINIADDMDDAPKMKNARKYNEDDLDDLKNFDQDLKNNRCEKEKKYKEGLILKFKEELKNENKENSKTKLTKELLKQAEMKKKTNKYSFMHPRGGQDCSNRTCPPGVDPDKYHESTHCLVFSQLWYTVYRMEKPVITHEISMEIFEKHEDLTGHVVWNDLTRGKPLILGPMKPEVTDKSDGIWAGYVGVDPPPHSFGLDPIFHRLLVPEPLSPCQERKYPELKGGPREWLVIPNYMITYDGSRCDKVGVGYEAFVKQPNRCDMPRGSCLNNQPKDLWCHDHHLEETGKPGSYFLKYFGQLPSCPIQNTTRNGQNLTFYFREPHFSTLHIELKTDYNLVLRPHAASVITEVYVDGTNYIKSTVTVKVTNSGLVYGVFFVALTDCPLDIPASFSNIKTKPAMIPPQHQHIFVIEIMSALPEKKFFCSIEAKNVKSDLLAFRRIRFQKNDRCICIWHCVCTCLETDGGLTCQPLPFDHYSAAGFHGGLPVAADYVQFTLFEELMTLLYHLFLTMTLILILMGIMKAIVGIYYKPIGEWGICSILGLPKPIKDYYEENLKGRTVIYDSCGWPIHPDTKKRVRNSSMIVELCINSIFFLIYPFVMINAIVKRLCFVDSSDESSKQMCCLCGQKHESGECPSLCILKSFGFHNKSNVVYDNPCSTSRRRVCRDVSIQHLPQECDECFCHQYNRSFHFNS